MLVECIRLAHGSGGGLTRKLVKDLFLRYFGGQELGKLADSAVLDLPYARGRRGRLAFTTDSYVISPLEFPGGDIGKLAVTGTINDLAAAGARPLWLSCGWILEEGLPVETLERLVSSMARTASEAGVEIVTGDTKVVPQGLADGAYVNTAGVGLVPDEREIGIPEVRAGDAILVNGTLGDHGMAVMMAREGIALSSPLRSDCAPLHSLVEALFSSGVEVHCLRDATRGGVVGVLTEIAEASGLGIEIESEGVPVRSEVAAAAEILGLEPLLVANEGKMVAFVAAKDANKALEVWRKHPYGVESALIGTVVPEHQRMLMERTPYGTRRIIRVPVGELLPRIC